MCVFFPIYIYIYIRRPRQTQGGARQGIRHLTLVGRRRRRLTTTTGTTGTGTTTTAAAYSRSRAAGRTCLTQFFSGFRRAGRPCLTQFSTVSDDTDDTLGSFWATFCRHGVFPSGRPAAPAPAASPPPRPPPPPAAAAAAGPAAELALFLSESRRDVKPQGSMFLEVAWAPSFSSMVFRCGGGVRFGGLQHQLEQHHQQQQQEQQQQAQQLHSLCFYQNPEGTSSLGAAWCFGVATAWAPAAPPPPPAAAAAGPPAVFGGRSVLQ